MDSGLELHVRGAVFLNGLFTVANRARPPGLTPHFSGRTHTVPISTLIDASRHARACNGPMALGRGDLSGTGARRVSFLRSAVVGRLAGTALGQTPIADARPEVLT